MRRLVYMFVWFYVKLWTFVAEQGYSANASPARFHPQLLYLRTGGGNHFRRCLLHQQMLIDKANISKAVWKNYVKVERGKQKSLGKWTKSMVMVWKPMAPCVSESVRWLSGRQRARIETHSWRTPLLSPTHTHPTPNLPSAAALNIHHHCYNHYYYSHEILI